MAEGQNCCTDASVAVWDSSTHSWHWGHQGLPLALPWGAIIRVDSCAGLGAKGISTGMGEHAELQEFPAAGQRTPRVVRHRKPLHGDELWSISKEQSEIILTSSSWGSL